MDFFAVTDHDTIAGALDLADLPDVIVGQEINALFPNDGTMIHVIALGLREDTHRAVQELRANVYELVSFLVMEKVFHCIAHPFFRMGRLSLAHFEKLLLLFKAFETEDGGKQIQPPTLLDDVLDSLTPDTFADLANKHGFAPYGPCPWRKTKGGGSDEHAGIAIGTTFTVTPRAVDVTALLAHLAEGRSRAAGQPGSIPSVAQQILGHAHAALRSRGSAATRSARMREVMVERLVGQPIPGSTASPFLRHTSIRILAEALQLLNKGSRLEHALERACASDKQVRRAFSVDLDVGIDAGRTRFATLARLGEHAAHHLRWNRTVSDEAMAGLVSALPVVPLAAALVAEYRQRGIMRTLRRKYVDGPGVQRGPVFSDMRASRMRASRSFRSFLGPELRQVRSLALLTSDAVAASSLARDLRAGRTIAVVDWLIRFSEQDYGRVYVHTSGPIGMLGVLVGVVLDMPVTLRFGLRGRRLTHGWNADDGRHALPRDSGHAVIAAVDEIRVHSDADASAAGTLGAASSRIRHAGLRRAADGKDASPVQPINGQRTR
ncbi:MAG: hypothetical protein MUE60_00740 [Candidatus Eisenbacteria bacterium]|jgi:hypothetical protein|nr:hypothetical protein [Candidatus Eisenbacteria bacterium]